MAARAVGSATISFGLVSIPVKLYSTAVSSSGVHFNLLHNACKGRLKQQYVCPQHENAVVPREEMVKGYEFAKDQYVTFTDEELKALEEKATQSVDIVEFVPADKVPQVFHEKSYYLGPDKGGERAYHLLATAMQKVGRVALAQYAARGKQYLVMVSPFGEGLLLQQLYYADEVRPFEEVPIGDAEVKDKELDLAVALIHQIARDDFKPEAYVDEAKRRVEAAVQQKIAGAEVSVAAPEPKAQIIDLMAALKASLGAPVEAKAEVRAEAVAAEVAEPVAERKGPKRAPRAAGAPTKKAKGE